MMGSTLLGLQIMASALLVATGFRLMIYGWANLSDNGLDRVFRRRRWGWTRIAAGHAIAFLGGGIATFGLMYWLIRGTDHWFW